MVLISLLNSGRMWVRSSIEISLLRVQIDSNDDDGIGDHFPVYEGYYPERYECVWNYEVNGIWSTCRIIVCFRYCVVVIMVVTCSVIVLILFIAIFIYAQKHRAEKRASLLHSYNKKLIETVTKQ